MSVSEFSYCPHLLLFLVVTFAVCPLSNDYDNKHNHMKSEYLHKSLFW